MIRFKLDSRRRGLLILGAVALLLGLIYRFAPYFEGFYADSGEIDLKEKQLSKYALKVQERAELEEKLKYLEKQLALTESGLLNGKTPPLAAVDIQNILNEIASQSGIKVKTVRVMQPEDSEDAFYLDVPVKFTITCNIRQLKEILYRIESSPKSLTVEEVRITVPRVTKVESIQSDITVSGFMKKTENETGG